MAGKDDIETAAPAAPAPPAGAVLKGMAGDLAVKLRATGDAFIAQPAEAHDAQKTAQIITGLARAGVALHQLQAQEDKAAECAEARVEERQVAKTRARVRQQFHPDEDDDTDMHDQDPRLDTPEGVAEIYADAERVLERIARRIETKAAELCADGDRGAEDVKSVAAPRAGRAASAH